MSKQLFIAGQQVVLDLTDAAGVIRQQWRDKGVGHVQWQSAGRLRVAFPDGTAGWFDMDLVRPAFEQVSLFGDGQP